MRYTKDFLQKLNQLNWLVLLQKEYDLLVEQKLHLRKLILRNFQDPSKKSLYDNDFRLVLKSIKMLEKQMMPYDDLLKNPSTIISRYMVLYEVSDVILANNLRIDVNVITNYLQNNRYSTDTKTFIYWAIRNFHLDANRYLSSIQTSSNFEPTEICL